MYVGLRVLFHVNFKCACALQTTLALRANLQTKCARVFVCRIVGMYVRAVNCDMVCASTDTADSLIPSGHHLLNPLDAHNKRGLWAAF